MTVASDLLDVSSFAQGIGFIVMNVGASHLFSHPLIGMYIIMCYCLMNLFRRFFRSLLLFVGWILDATSDPSIVFSLFGVIEFVGGLFAIASYLTFIRKQKVSILELGLLK